MEGFREALLAQEAKRKGANPMAIPVDRDVTEAHQAARVEGSSPRGASSSHGVRGIVASEEGDVASQEALARQREAVTHEVPGLTVDTARLHAAFLEEQRHLEPSLQFGAPASLPAPAANVAALAGSDHDGLDPASHGVVRHPGVPLHTESRGEAAAHVDEGAAVSLEDLFPHSFPQSKPPVAQRRTPKARISHETHVAMEDGWPSAEIRDAPPLARAAPP